MKSLQTGHIGLNVTDLDRSVAFYRSLLGLDLAREGADGDRRFAFLAREGVPVLTLWQQSEGHFSTGAPGLHHLSFQVDTLDEVYAAERTAKELGASFEHDGVVPHGEGTPSGGIFFTDPDGIRLEVYTPTGVDRIDAEPPVADAPTCGFF